MNKVYAFSGRFMFYALYPVIRLFPSPRTRVLLTDGTGSILLIRSWFGRQRWELPGGGIKRGESAKEAAIREVAEETGIRLASEEVSLVGEFSRKASGLSHGVILFYARCDARVVRPHAARPLEVLEVKWQPINRLPGRTNMFVVRALRKLEEIEA